MTEECEYCKLTSAKHLAQCQTCKKFFCNQIQEGEKFCDLIKHMLQEKHAAFHYPYSSIAQDPRCEVCGSKNPLRLSYFQIDNETHVACLDKCTCNERFSEVQMMPPIPFKHTNNGKTRFLEALIPLASQEIVSQIEKLREILIKRSLNDTEAAQFNTQHIENQIMKQALDELSQQQLNERQLLLIQNAKYLPKIPIRFDIPQKQLYRINGDPYNVKLLEKEIENKIVTYNPETKILKLTGESSAFDRLQEQPISYQQIFSEVLNHKYEYDVIESKKHLSETNNKVVYVRQNPKSKYFEFLQVGWSRFNTINGQIPLKNTEMTVQLIKN